jgi:DNA-directed RNA polymerase subunit RPC12/RpoP
MSLKRFKGKEVRKSKPVGSGKIVLSSKNVNRVGRSTAPKLAVKSALKSPARNTIKVAAKPQTKAISRPVVKEAPKLALTEVKPPAKPERIHSHPTMCLHCHLIVEMFHERGADPVKGAWQCPRCGHKYLFSHWKIKRQARGKPEAA